MTELENEMRRLRRTVRTMGAGFVGVAGLCLIAATRPGAPDLRARSLTIVDANGTPRVIIAAPIPDPFVNGRRGKRASAGSGVVLNGPDGNERGGYFVTDVGQEGVLTLDAQGGTEVFKVVANPNSGASLFLNHQSGSEVALTTFRDRPELHMMDSTRRAIATIPADAPPLK